MFKSNIFNDFQLKLIDKSLPEKNFLHVLRNDFSFDRSSFVVFFRYNGDIFSCKCNCKHIDPKQKNVEIQKLIKSIELAISNRIKKLENSIFLISEDDKSIVRNHCFNIEEIVLREIEDYSKFREFKHVQNTRYKYNPVDKAEIFLDRDKSVYNAYRSVMNIFGIRKTSIEKFIDNQIEISKNMKEKAIF